MLRKKKTVTPEAARLRMADLCARSEQCESDIMEKLLKLGLGRPEASAVVEELVAGRFIDNSRYARALARDQVRFSGWGRRKIAAKLMSKRIDAGIIREALADIDREEYMEAAMRAGRAKARSLGLAQYDDRMKLLRHLAVRGFEGGVASEVVNRLRLEAEEDVEGA